MLYGKTYMPLLNKVLVGLMPRQFRAGGRNPHNHTEFPAAGYQTEEAERVVDEGEGREWGGVGVEGILNPFLVKGIGGRGRDRGRGGGGGGGGGGGWRGCGCVCVD